MSPRLRHLIIPLALIAASFPATLRADESQEYQRLLDRDAPALVTLKYVLKFQGQMGSRDIENEVTGLMIDPQGLVLCSNSQFTLSMFARRAGGSATPTAIKVLVGDDTEGVEAKLLASDTELDLAWVQVKKAPEKPYPAVDLARSADAKPGQRILGLHRLGKFFDRAPVVTEGRVTGRTAKPRELVVPSESLEAEAGLPVYSADGKVIGIIVVQMPDAEEMEAAGAMMRQSIAMMILPAPEVVKATQRARDSEEEEDEDIDAPSSAKTTDQSREKPAATSAPAKP